MTEAAPASFVVGTAGHIDHGKSALVKALTNIDPDRLEEEKRRGMTIDLGFANLELPGGRQIGIVDVPGHQRFLKNMLAGVHGMDAVLFVIAADEGPMPQTREHLAIIDLLQIRHGVVVLSKKDLVDDAWLALVRDDVSRLLKGTTLESAPTIAASSVTGEGLDELRAALDRELQQTPQRPDLSRPRLPVDRSFPMSGFGTVVTGTLIGGSLVQGEEVLVLPAGRRARIRGLQQHNVAVERAHPGTRTAVNLSGLEHTEVGRGDVLAPGGLASSRRVDVRLNVLADAVQPLHHRQRLLIYHGTSELMVEVSLLQGDQLRPGEGGLAQLFLTSPLVGLEGDRFVLRVPSPAETVAGGQIIDMAPRRHRRRDASVVESLAARAEADASTLAVLELAKHPLGLDVETLAGRVGLQPAALAAVLAGEIDHGRLFHLGARWLTPHAWERLAARLTGTVQAYHQAHPLRRGMPKEELRSKMGIPVDLLSGSLSGLIDAGIVRESGGEIALSDHRQGLTPEQETAARAFLTDLNEHPFNPPPLAELVRRHHLTPALLQYLVSEQRVVRINDDTVFARPAYDQAVSRLRTHLAEHRTLTVAAARDVLGSTRRYVLPLLEWLDAQKITRRVGDDRILRD